MRKADIHRRTDETEIHIQLNLDGRGRHQADTGLGFLDHMLAHLAVHGLFDLTIEAQGDLHVDSHHTVEDCALALGQAFNQALGGRAGIARVGVAYVPMDETLARVVVDLSGRPYAVIQAGWHSPGVGGIPTSLFPHFLQSFSVRARANLHAEILYGRDDHHQVEALFKGLGRALDQACQLDPRRGEEVPSTKGTLA